MRIPHKPMPRFTFETARLLVSALFDALAVAELAIAVAVVALKFFSWAVSRSAPPQILFPALHETAEVAALAVLCAIIVQGALFALMRIWQRRAAPAELPARKGFRGYQGGTPARWSKRDRRRLLRDMLRAGAS